MSVHKQIYRALWKYFDRKKYDYQLENSYVFDWESDFFCVSRSGYVYELEVKVSRSDFFADFRKKDKHEILETVGNYKVIKGHEQYNGWWMKNGRREYFVLKENKDKVLRKDKTPVRTNISIRKVNQSRPHKFVYVTPKDLITADEVPEYAGLMQLTESGRRLKYIKRPPFLHKEELEWLDKRLLKKFYWAYTNLILKHKR